MRISAVIPTSNRPESLARTLGSLCEQTCPPDEIVLVDASDEPYRLSRLPQAWRGRIRLMHSAPSVCRQRNLGIRSARGRYVLLCDDDIELPPDYAAALAAHLERTGATAASGLILQRGERGRWVYEYPVRSLRRLIWTFVFQLGIWGSIDCTPRGRSARWLSACLSRHYARVGNSITRAGWPVLTQLADDVIRTRIYGLGAAMIDRVWLASHPFDEVLDRHGIGDNYGVAMQLPEPVHVLKSTAALHHAEQGNRLPAETTTFRRILALHYFMTIHAPTARVPFLVWSLLGSAVSRAVHERRWPRAQLKAARLILSGRNPYLLARETRSLCVEPAL